MPIELEKVRSLFDRPEKTGDSQFMRREVASRMDERLSLVRIDPSYILDAGCGYSADTLLLAKRFDGAHMIGLDMSWPVLAMAQEEKSGSVTGFVCGNFAAMPFDANSIDVIWSNLALHWHPAPVEVFREWNRVLKPNGLLMFSCFGSGTFEELKKSFSNIDSYSHIHSFADMIPLGDGLVEAGFTEPVLEREWIDVTYKDVEKLLSDVRAFGGNAMSGRRMGLFGKNEYEKLLKSLEKSRDGNGNLSLGFEIIVAHAFKKDSSLPAGEKVMQFYGRNYPEN